MRKQGKNRRFECKVPGFEDAWVELPEHWLGLHAKRRDEAIKAAEDLDSDTLINFSVALAIAEDWDIPGIKGPPEKWDFENLRLEVIMWVSQTVLSDFLTAFLVPKVFASPSQIGPATSEATMTESDGNSTTTD